MTGVAQVLQQIVRQYGESYQVYRTGGEEFTMVFPNSTVQDAFQVMSHCWQAIRSANFTYEMKKIPITISSGISGLHDDDAVPEAIYKRADDSLYGSKAHGRDTITLDGITQQLQDDSNEATYAYFVTGVYAVAGDRRRVANELRLRRYDHKKQIWTLPSQRHLNIDRRIELMRAALINSRCRVQIKTLSIVDFLSQDVANKLVAYFKSPDGPDELFIELHRLPTLDLLISMVAFYHQAGVKIILGQINSNHHFEQITNSLEYLDGLKIVIAAQSKRNTIAKDIQFWGELAQTWQIGFSIDGVGNQELCDWLLQQPYPNFLEGDFFGVPTLPLLTT
ncbi:diguanylate cyclase [Loigolactobacillus binensis]|uniref:Diguanylate cyclase n=1 Tax=Loigolactobacillus binensis TaxID=2559922 RepID=A0ABW3EC29_9LACO|nr:diguanylate cyclase [Loigolactobacillus binensis]